MADILSGVDDSPHSSPGFSLGARISLLIAVLLLVPAAYLLVAPLERPSDQGAPFGCGTAISPPHTQFARSVCGDLNRRNALRSGAFGVAAVLLAGGGVVLFGPGWRWPQRHRP